MKHDMKGQSEDLQKSHEKDGSIQDCAREMLHPQEAEVEV